MKYSILILFALWAIWFIATKNKAKKPAPKSFNNFSYRGRQTEKDWAQWYEDTIK